MRTILVIRHGRSTANEPGVPSGMTAEGLAFANRFAELDDKGKRECNELAAILPTEHGVDAYNTHVAMSEFVRTHQTAMLLGFRGDLATPYRELNEVDHGMALETLRVMLRQNQIPPIALRTAETTLQRAPSESIWVSHGLLIAGMCAVLGITNRYERPVPRQCEVRQLTF